MTKLSLMTQFPFKEVITSVELVDLTGDGIDNIVISTISGDVRLLKFSPGDSKQPDELSKTSGLPPAAAMDIGDITGDGIPDFAVGGLDNILRVIGYADGKFEVRTSTPLGILPTAICATNVANDEKAEVIVATNDRALRCYGWFDQVLDKLAHKVVDRPTFSMEPLRSIGYPYDRIIFGDDSGHLYVYQYADDRLHERAKVKIGGDVHLLCTGNVTGNRTDEVIAVSDGRTMSLLGIAQSTLKTRVRIKTPAPVTSLGVMPTENESDEGSILVGLGDSTILLLNYDGEEDELVESASLKTTQDSIESLLAFGDLKGEGETNIVQAVGNVLYIISISEE